MCRYINYQNYKDLKAISMESRLLSAVFLPEQGAKLASLVCRKSGREFLVQAPGENYKKLEYAGEYVAAECSGFDDMFPNIDEYEYTKFPWKGLRNAGPRRSMQSNLGSMRYLIPGNACTAGYTA